ncbi:uncharacterized protein CIMG_13372 [Coccidioides immitis RS]|uniref:Uncharacterized protein n=2 Tax=Coccidioides immitis TaxID=5501 RepID=A0A0E1RXB1_COCIM|nr:uncharacterized protein CIMG_13372 [Coccidioides immitis RS]EAS33603.1 hypothetical protein CIMG_13372 [Coccidioides immitis RS]
MSGQSTKYSGNKSVVRKDKSFEFPEGGRLILYLPFMIPIQGLSREAEFWKSALWTSPKAELRHPKPWARLVGFLRGRRLN